MLIQCICIKKCDKIWFGLSEIKHIEFGWTSHELINIILTENEKTEFGQIMYEKPVFGQREGEWSEFKWTECEQAELV